MKEEYPSYIGAIYDMINEFDETENKESYINKYLISDSYKIFEFKAELIKPPQQGELTGIFKILEIISKTPQVKIKSEIQ